MGHSQITFRPIPPHIPTLFYGVTEHQSTFKCSGHHDEQPTSNNYNNLQSSHNHCFLSTENLSLTCLSLQLQTSITAITMSSSITIPKRAGESSKAASSSSSSYSSSPHTPQNQAASASASTSPASSTTAKYGHDRRPSLLSKFVIIRIPDYQIAEEYATCTRFPP